MNLAPYAGQIGLTLIALLATALCFYILGMRHERTFQRDMSSRRAKRLVETCDYLREVIHRAYPDPATHDLAMRRVADDMGRSAWFPLDPTDKPLADRAHPDGAYADQDAR